MTIVQALAVGVMRLRSGSAAPEVRGSARADAQVLLSEVLQWDRARLLAHGNEELDPDLLDVFGLLLDERMRGVPVAYLTHKAGFYGREFYVDEHVLVPRPESEHLVEAALADLKDRLLTTARPRVLDVGTGSGALAITLAAELPQVDATGVDVSDAALAVAERNGRICGVEVRWLRSDLCAAVRGERFDCILANLPYVPSADVPLPPAPAGFEPQLALDGGSDGLDLYRRLVRELPEAAAPGALCLFEAAPATIYGLAAEVQRAFPAGRIEIGNDYAGLERYVSVKLPG